ncbi:MAG: PAS domain-containing sensor histidine kinase, partial [Ignavibacteriaceae bacterium]|nr:PAS domain-containing sensor histidine kinase [Ignavibacteriaceae bacterium]
MFRIIHPDDFPSAVEKAKKLMANKYKRSDSFEYRIFTREGAILWIRNKLTVIRSKDVVIKVYGLVSDISPQKRAEEEVRKTAENLKKLNETKDKFLSIISHDMRTPFSSILGFTDLLLENENLNSEQRRNYVMNIQDSTKTMLALVNSLLDYTRLHTGRFKFEPSKQFLRQLVQKSVSATSGNALPKNISFSIEIHEEELVFVDQNLILQVFNNLFSNAIKFTPPGGRITIGTLDEQNQRFLKCFVSDTGVGIKKEDIPKIFNVDTKFTTQGTEGE